MTEEKIRILSDTFSKLNKILPPELQGKIKENLQTL